MSHRTVGSSPRERTPLDRSTLRDSSVLRYELNQPCPFLKLHRRTARRMAEGNGIETIARAQGGARLRRPQRSPRPTLRTRSAFRRPLPHGTSRGSVDQPTHGSSDRKGVPARVPSLLSARVDRLRARCSPKRGRGPCGQKQRGCLKPCATRRTRNQPHRPNRGSPSGRRILGSADAACWHPYRVIIQREERSVSPSPWASV